jgi:hypothetical protein
MGVYWIGQHTALVCGFLSPVSDGGGGCDVVGGSVAYRLLAIFPPATLPGSIQVLASVVIRPARIALFILSQAPVFVPLKQLFSLRNTSLARFPFLL